MVETQEISSKQSLTYETLYLRAGLLAKTSTAVTVLTRIPKGLSSSVCRTK